MQRQIMQLPAVQSDRDSSWSTISSSLHQYSAHYKTSRVHSPRDATYERGCPLNRNTDTIDSGIDGFRESHQRTYHNLRLLRNAFCILIGIGCAIFY